MSEIFEYVKSQKDTKLKLRELVELNRQTNATQTKNSAELVHNQVIYVEAIKMMGNEIFDLGTENEALRSKMVR